MMKAPTSEYLRGYAIGLHDGEVQAGKKAEERDEAVEVVKRLRAILQYDDPLALWTDEFLSRVGGSCK